MACLCWISHVIIATHQCKVYPFSGHPEHIFEQVMFARVAAGFEHVERLLANDLVSATSVITPTALLSSTIWGTRVRFTLLDEPSIGSSISGRDATEADLGTADGARETTDADRLPKMSSSSLAEIADQGRSSIFSRSGTILPALRFFRLRSSPSSRRGRLSPRRPGVRPDPCGILSVDVPRRGTWGGA